MSLPACEKYEIFLFGITKDGHWLTADSTEDIRSGAWEQKGRPALLSPDAGTHGFMVLADGSGASVGQTEHSEGSAAPVSRWETVPVDVVFPVLHGIWGEDGTVQGLLELACIPYVSCGVLSSAVTMDKAYTKIIADAAGVRQADYVIVTKSELKDIDQALDRCEAGLAYPVFVKPSRAGSSKGVSQAHDRAELEAALREAVRHDTRVLVEETIVGHEVECAVLTVPGGTIASGVGEILSAGSFYDFDSKYQNSESRTVTDPKLPEGAAERVRSAALTVFEAVDGFSLSRVDFFVTEAGEVIFNEINTIPGFTSISMYPQLWEAAGISQKELVEKLIQTAFMREDSYTVYRESRA